MFVLVRSEQSYVKPRCDNRNRSLCSSCNKVALEAMWKSTNHVIIWFGGWDKDISSPIGSCSIAVDFSHNFHLNTLIKKSMTTDFEFFVFYFSSLKCEWYLMGIIILICYIFLICDFQSMMYSGFFFFFLFHFGTGTWAFISDLPERCANLFAGESRSPSVNSHTCTHAHTHTCMQPHTHTLTCMRATSTQCVCVCTWVCVPLCVWYTQLYSIGLPCRGDKGCLHYLF